MSGDAAAAKGLTPEESALLEETFRQVPYVRLLGVKFVSAERGSATFALEVREELKRMGGLLHGGAIASLLDTAAAFAVHTVLEPEKHTVTIDLTLHFLRPVTSGRVEARARVLREGRRVCIIVAEATDPTGVLTATATTTYLKQGLFFAESSPARPAPSIGPFRCVK